MAGNIFKNHRVLLLAGCMAIAALAALPAAHAANDGVEFDGAATNNGVATGTNNIAISSSTGGAATTAVGSASAIAIGSGATAGAAGTAGDLAIGLGATATGNSSTAVGTLNFATGLQSQAFGFANAASGINSVAVGLINTASGTSASAFGSNNQATGNGSSAFGINNTASGITSLAIGADSTASGINSVAMGTSATAGFTGSVAIGPGATTTRANQQSFGTAASTYTMSGLTSAASLAAQSGPISFVTTDTAGNLATVNLGNVAALDGRVTSLENSVNNLNFDVRKAFEGAAVAIAMGGSALPDNKRFAISANWGNFSGENAFGGMAQMRISNNFVANAAIGAGFARGGIGGRVGGTFAW